MRAELQPLVAAQHRAMPFTRLTDCGMDPADARRLLADTTAGIPWQDAATIIADVQLERARSAEAAGHGTTARQVYRFTSAALMFAQMAYQSDTPGKRELYARHTAATAALGLSERRLGAALRDRPRDTYTLSTKVGRLLVPDPDGGAGDDLAHGFAVPATHRRIWDFTADGVLRSLEASLQRLGVDRVDVALLHDPDDHAEQALREAYPALERLRAEGVIGAIGVGTNQSALPARFVRETDIDVVLLAGRYTLLEQDGLAELLPEAAARGRSVVIGGVFNSGLLTAPRPGATYDYAPAPQPVLERALRLLAVCERHGVPLRAAALRFPFGHPAVASVLTGARSPHEVRDTVEQLGRPIPDALWDELRAEGLLDPDIPVPAARSVGEAMPPKESPS